MSNRQARIARKRAQRAGLDAYVHLKPAEATPPEERAVRTVAERFGGDRSAGLAMVGRLSNRHLKRMGLDKKVAAE